MTMIERIRNAMRQRAIERPIRQVGRVWLVDNAEEIGLSAAPIPVDAVAHWRFDSRDQAEEFVSMEIARAAIEAMREPTEKLRDEMHEWLTDMDPAERDRFWSAMIAAALGEP